MFVPPRCPYRACRHHHRPARSFFRRHGAYHPKCRPRPVPRFRCRACLRTFSRQTFRSDYRDHRPDLNARLFTALASGLGLRQSARTLGLSLRCTELKFRKLARHLRRLNLNLWQPLSTDASFQLDELETFESERNTRPLSVPVLIETKSRYVVWAESATIRPRGKMTRQRKQRIARSEERYGPRKDLSRRALKRTLRRGADLALDLPFVVLSTDEKSSYPGLAGEAFGKHRLIHLRTNSKLARTTWNPLFPINHTEALARDLMGRLRRQSWLASKKRRYLDLGLQLFMAYRNFVRKRFNYDEESPAQLLGFAPRRLRPGEVLSWRQDWNEESIHPLSLRGTSIESWRRRAARAA